MNPRGQTLVLLALTMLLLTLMVLMTLSIGTAAARKADLANAADAAAYSTAIATARTFNTAAILNRTIVSHYVAMSGVQAQMVYASTVHNYFNLAAVMFRLYDDNDSNGDGVVNFVDSYSEPPALTGCSARTSEVRDASYEMWHVALRGMRPPGGSNPPDQVNAYCKGSGAQACSQYRPWLAKNEAVLEEAATRQSEAIHDAIWDLTEIQRETYKNLINDVDDAKWAKAVALASGIGAIGVNGEGMSKNELEASTGNTGAGAQDPALSFQRPFAQAILGTRFRREPLMLPTVSENLPPMVTQMKAITDAAFAAYPNQPFSVDFGVAQTSADVAYQGSVSQMTEDPLMAGEPSLTDAEQLFPSIQYVHGRSVKGVVTTIYRDACLGRMPIRLISGEKKFNPASGRNVDLVSDGNMDVYIRSAAPSQGGGKHVDYGAGYLDGIHWDLQPGGGGCHGFHQHYLHTEESVHDLKSDTLPKDVLGFVLPDDDPRIVAKDMSRAKGAHGVWGQPVLPVMLTQKHKAKDDKFNLNVGFKFSSVGNGARFNMRKPVDTALAPATAIAYYHRRGHLGEPPNMLNPFWHATLVPLEIDERKDGPVGKRYDPTEETQAPGPTRMRQLIEAALPSGGADVVDAYNGLRNDIPGMAKPATGSK